jgi:hypothetical protein
MNGKSKIALSVAIGDTAEKLGGGKFAIVIIDAIKPKRAIPHLQDGSFLAIILLMKSQSLCQSQPWILLALVTKAPEFPYHNLL